VFFKQVYGAFSSSLPVQNTSGASALRKLGHKNGAFFYLEARLWFRT
jgi:hypothetical protein